MGLLEENAIPPLLINPFKNETNVSNNIIIYITLLLCGLVGNQASF